MSGFSVVSRSERGLATLSDVLVLELIVTVVLFASLVISTSPVETDLSTYTSVSLRYVIGSPSVVSSITGNNTHPTMMIPKITDIASFVIVVHHSYFQSPYQLVLR